MIRSVKYRPHDNAAYIRFSPAKVLESEEVPLGAVSDYDEAGHIVGMELLDARAQLPPEYLTEAA
jgi:uncharacterized protein YuzE